jgi:hypothetical protein
MHSMEKEFHRQPFPFVEEQPSEVDIAEWKRREDLREYVFNRGSAATEGDRQANHSHMMHLHSGPCWCCAFPMSQYNAARSIHIKGYAHAGGKPADNYRCLNCGVRLAHVVPFFAMGASWLWGRPVDMTLQEMLDVVEAHRPIWSKA